MNKFSAKKPFRLAVIMRYSFIFISLFVLLSSCVDYATISTIKNVNQKIALQDYYSPCCGSCGQRIVVDNSDGKQYALQVNCQVETADSRLCTPFQLGTQKQVIFYRKNKIISKTYYKPVYDTIELKRLFPKVERGEYYDSNLTLKPIIPLSSIDSTMIEKYFLLTKKTTCNDKYIKLIKGFVLFKENDHNSIEKKKVKFKQK